MKQIKLKKTLLILVAFLGFSSSIFAQAPTLKWATYGAPLPQVFSNNDILNYCGAAPVNNLQVHCEYGGSSSTCPINRYELTVDLYKNGTKIDTKTVNSQSGTIDVYWNIYTMSPGIYKAGINLRVKDFGCLTYHTVNNSFSNSITVTQVNAAPNFNINGGTTVNLTTVSSCISNIRLNASSTWCETAYNINVQESDQYWNRTYNYEFGVWFNGQAPDNINLQNIASAYSIPPYYTGAASRQGSILIGGNLPNGTPRYYRVSLCTGPTWTCKTVLLRVIEGCKTGLGLEDTNEYVVINDPNNQQSEEVVTSINDLISHNADIQIYPNPSTGIFNIEFNEGSAQKVVVYDAIGKVVYENIVDVNSTAVSIDLSEFNSGMYFVKINAGEKMIMKKLIKN